ncbi:hypothetical protein A6M57_9860 [Staphylococcus pseudintermedius]|nr:hypothetical protein A6M57_9860 [Staphylococcus pseudintermedius]
MRGQYDKIFVTHELSVLLQKSNSASIKCLFQSSQVEGPVPRTRSHEGNQKPQIIGRASLTKILHQ